MKLKHLLILPVLTAVGCQEVQRDSYDSFDDYPVPEGDWEEMVYAPEATKFALWAPTAEEVSLKLYAEGQGGEPLQTLSMKEDEGGMWRTTVDGDLDGRFYTFDVKVDGAWLGDTPGVWAKAVGVNGDRAAVVDLDATDPEGWDKYARPELKSFADIIIYEMHHRDFSIDSLSGVSHRGKFLALTEAGTKSAEGQKTGIDHLKELGVTHVHILPSFDYSSVDETKLDVPQYNWGYDPKNYNVPEGSYSTDPYQPETRIREFKQMVMALHRAGIRVVMDVVYNHTAVTDGSNFERTVPGYFYRQNPDGTPKGGRTCQGYKDDSFWARGQAWGVYGSAIGYTYTHDEKFLDVFRKALDFYLSRLPEDLIPCWDMIFAPESGEPRDSSSAAIVACGLLEAAKYAAPDEAEQWRTLARQMLASLVDHYAVKPGTLGSGQLLHGTYSKKSPYNTCTPEGVDECTSWGDYFYMEALTRLTKDWEMYW